MIIAIANANGNHTGAFKKPTAAKPMPINRPERPASEGRERRQTKLICCLLERTYVERLLAVSGMCVAEGLESGLEVARYLVAPVDDRVEVVPQTVEVALLDVRGHVPPGTQQGLIVRELQVMQHRGHSAGRGWVRERAERGRARSLVGWRCARMTHLRHDRARDAQHDEHEQDQPCAGQAEAATLRRRLLLPSGIEVGVVVLNDLGLTFA